MPLCPLRLLRPQSHTHKQTCSSSALRAVTGRTSLRLGGTGCGILRTRGVSMAYFWFCSLPRRRMASMLARRDAVRLWSCDGLTVNRHGATTGQLCGALMVRHLRAYWMGREGGGRLRKDALTPVRSSGSAQVQFAQRMLGRQRLFLRPRGRISRSPNQVRDSRTVRAACRLARDRRRGGGRKQRIAVGCSRHDAMVGAGS